MSARWDASGLRERVRYVYITVLVFGLLGVAFAIFTFRNLYDGQNRLTDRLSPSAIQTQVWLVGLVDQARGLRGYVLTAEPSLLDEYSTGAEDAERARAFVAEHLRGEPDLIRQVEEVEAALDRWRSDIAEPLIEQTLAEGRSPDAIAAVQRSGTVFQRVRDQFGQLQSAIQERRDEAHDDLDQRTRELAVVTGLASFLTAAGVAFTWVGLKRWVLGPLDRIGADARVVASGELRHPITPVGPPDLRRLADDAEAMRHRIVDELAIVEEARVQLENQAADLERSNQELEQFAYVASHDLQEPLRKVTGFCQLLQRRYGGQLDERADEYIEYAVDGAKRMQRLINDLLAFSRVGRTTDRFEPVDLEVVAASALRTLQERIDETGAAVAIGDLPTVAGDATLLEVLLQNLVGNGLKFRRPDVAPEVTVAAELRGDDWWFSCSDNGIGIEPQHAEKVFVIFQRLNDRDAYSGTGIGLAMCRKVVEFHGGRIWVDTEAPGPGTTFRWTLPAATDLQPAHVTVAEILGDAEDGGSVPPEADAAPAEEPAAAGTA